MIAARKHAAARPPELQPVWEPAEVIAERVAGAKYAAIRSLRKRSANAGNVATAKLCKTALEALDISLEARPGTARSHQRGSEDRDPKV